MVHLRYHERGLARYHEKRIDFVIQRVLVFRERDLQQHAPSGGKPESEPARNGERIEPSGLRYTRHQVEPARMNLRTVATIENALHPEFKHTRGNLPEHDPQCANPAVCDSLLVTCIRETRRGGGKLPVVGPAAPLGRLPRLRGRHQHGIRARARLEFPQTFPRIRERFLEYRAGDILPHGAKRAVVYQHQAVPLRVRHPDSRLPVHEQR